MSKIRKEIGLVLHKGTQLTSDLFYRKTIQILSINYNK